MLFTKRLSTHTGITLSKQLNILMEMWKLYSNDSENKEIIMEITLYAEMKDTQCALKNVERKITFIVTFLSIKFK